MKAFVSILLGILLVWMQAASTASSFSTEPSASMCRQCACKQRDCCVKPAPKPQSSPLPALPPQSAAPLGHLGGQYFLPTTVIWSLEPALAPSSILYADSPAVRRAASPPFYTLHCAFLI